jgi:hypothetical protein
MDRACSMHACIILVGKPDERDNFGNSGINGRIILKWMLQKWQTLLYKLSKYYFLNNLIR